MFSYPNETRTEEKINDIHKKVDSMAWEYAMDAIIDMYRRQLDLSLLERNLQLSVDERFIQLMKLQEFAEELKAAGERVRKEND